ncbi:hypothetical protein BH10ACT6_BH10ACT6_01180 [soil metagenome]
MPGPRFGTSAVPGIRCHPTGRPLKETPMTDTITLTGLVATTPRHLVTSEGCLVL